jgi:hypothetical protein
VAGADGQQGSLLEWKLKAGRKDRPVLSPVTRQPLVIRLEINNPIFQKAYFAGFGCVAEVAKPLEDRPAVSSSETGSFASSP